MCFCTQYRKTLYVIGLIEQYQDTIYNAGTRSLQLQYFSDHTNIKVESFSPGRMFLSA